MGLIKMNRNYHKIIYTSSPDRGLEHLLKMWPDVKKAVPEAELYIAYGFAIFDRMYENTNPGAMQWKEKMLEMMKQPGITDYGRLSQPDVEKLMRSCAIFAYPTHFSEINCISALKSQYLGLEPVVINYAALKETVQFGRKIEGDIFDEEVQNEFKKQLIDALQNPMSEEKRQEMTQWAKQFEWSKIAFSWTEEFKK